MEKPNQIACKRPCLQALKFDYNYKKLKLKMTILAEAASFFGEALMIILAAIHDREDVAS